MRQELDGLVDLYDQGGITRRQLLQALVVMGVGGQLGSRAPTRTINHVTLYVSDVARSKAFYQAVTGLAIREEDPTFCEFRLEGAFLGLYKAEGGQRPGFNHFCLGVDGYDPPSQLTRLKAAAPGSRVTLEFGDQVYIEDPDGVRVQFADVKYKA